MNFDPELAIELSTHVHQAVENCPHDIGIGLAQIAAKYHEEEISKLKAEILTLKNELETTEYLLKEAQQWADE